VLYRMVGKSTRLYRDLKASPMSTSKDIGEVTLARHANLFYLVAGKLMGFQKDF
jgi:hypothetical protein